MNLDELKLTEPTEAMEEAFWDFIEEFRAFGEKGRIEGSGVDFLGDFAAYVQKNRDYSLGLNLPDNWLPGSTFWLVRNEKIIGVCNIRHQLNEYLRDFGGHIGYSIRPSERGKGCGTEMLRLALEKARELGIDRALVTCGKDNIVSQRVIQTNGGVMESESYSEQGGRMTQRYWIKL